MTKDSTTHYNTINNFHKNHKVVFTCPLCVVPSYRCHTQTPRSSGHASPCEPCQCKNVLHTFFSCYFTAFSFILSHLGQHYKMYWFTIRKDTFVNRYTIMVDFSHVSFTPIQLYSQNTKTTNEVFAVDLYMT